jgi:hypothetical protein
MATRLEFQGLDWGRLRAGMHGVDALGRPDIGPR